MDKYLNTKSIIPVFSVKEKIILNKIYKIYNWNDTLNYFKNYKKNDLKYGFQRILSYSWKVFFNEYKNNLNQILEIYKIYTIIENIDLNESQLKDKIKNIDIKSSDLDTENFYLNILK